MIFVHYFALCILSSRNKLILIQFKEGPQLSHCLYVKQSHQCCLIWDCVKLSLLHKTFSFFSSKCCTFKKRFVFTTPYNLCMFVVILHNDLFKSEQKLICDINCCIFNCQVNQLCLFLVLPVLLCRTVTVSVTFLPKRSSCPDHCMLRKITYV